MDFDKCFALLASRPAHAHTHCEEAHHRHDDDGKDVEKLAETLHEQLGGISNSDDAQEHQPLEELSVVALTQVFFKLQETRVQIYSDFQKGFEVHQQAAYFPEFSAGITTRFSSVSLQINKIEQAFVAKKKPVLAQCVRKIQLEEKEKLLMTSALLVEKMRLRDAMNRSEPDGSITSLLDKSIETLTRQHTSIILRINELLDELRMEVADIDGEE